MGVWDSNLYIFCVFSIRLTYAYMASFSLSDDKVKTHQMMFHVYHASTGTVSVNSAHRVKYFPVGPSDVAASSCLFVVFFSSHLVLMFRGNAAMTQLQRNLKDSPSLFKSLHIIS